MSEMTSQERIAAALDGQPVDHLPFCPFLAYVWEHFEPAIQEAGQLAFHHLTGADPLWRGAPCPVRFERDGVETREWEDAQRIHVEIETPVGTLSQTRIKSRTGDTAFLVEHPLKTEADCQIQLWIEAHTRAVYDPHEMDEHLRDKGREGLSIGMLIPRSKSAYQSLVEHYMGTEELIYAQADYPDTVDALWQAMVANDLAAARLAAQAPGYDYYLTWEDSGTQNYSPRQYQRYIASEIGQWCHILAAADKRYIQHACGHLRHILKPMQGSGPYGVESISPPPTGDISIREARALVGADFAIIGGIEPTAFLNLSPRELEPYVEGVIADLRGGPFLLANSDSCPPGVTVEKFRLVADIAKRFS